MHAARAQVKIISICLDFVVIALFSLIVFQFLRDFKLNKGPYRSIDAWSFRIEHKTFLRCCVVNLNHRHSRMISAHAPLQYSRTSLIRRLKGQSTVSVLERCLYFRGHHDDVMLKTVLAVLCVQ